MIDPKIVMVVEPDHETRVIARRILEDAGCHVLSAIKGVDALRILKCSARPSLIFLATELVVMTGEEFLEKLFEFPEYGDIPVVQMRTVNENVIRGVRASVFKPLSKNDLLESVSGV